MSLQLRPTNLNEYEITTFWFQHKKKAKGVRNHNNLCFIKACVFHRGNNFRSHTMAVGGMRIYTEGELNCKDIKITYSPTCIINYENSGVAGNRT